MKRISVLILVLALMLLSACGVDNPDAESKLQDKMVREVKEYMTELLEEEVEDGYLSEYEFIDIHCVEKGSEENPDGAAYNVVCQFGVTYAGDDKPMLEMEIERLFLVEEEEDDLEITEYDTWSILRGHVSGRDNVDISYVPVIEKSEVKGKTVEEISSMLISDFLNALCTPDDDRTYRVTEFDDLKVNSVIDARSTEFEKSIYWSEDIIPEGAVTCWIPEATFEWDYVGYMGSYGYRGNAFLGDDDSIENGFQDSWFVVVEWDDRYELYTNVTVM